MFSLTSVFVQSWHLPPLMLKPPQSDRSVHLMAQAAGSLMAWMSDGHVPPGYAQPLAPTWELSVRMYRSRIPARSRVRGRGRMGSLFRAPLGAVTLCGRNHHSKCNSVHVPWDMLCPGGRLQLVLMRHPPSYLPKLGGGVAVGGGGGGSSRGSGGVQPGVGGGGCSCRGSGGIWPGVRVRARVRAKVAVRACSPPVALLQVKIFSCCFNTNMNSLQNFEYFEYKHII